MANKQPEIVGKVLDKFAEDKKAHDTFVEKADSCYRAYRGILEKRSEAATWTNKQHPAIVLQSIETMVANLLSPSPKWRLRALPILDNPQVVEEARAGAKANELLLSHQLTLDGYAQKQRLFDLQGLITGLTASKQFWLHKEGPVRSRKIVHDPLYNLYGQQIGVQPRLDQQENIEVLRDDPTFEVLDVRHFIPQQGAVSLAACERVTHRCFYSAEKLKEFEKQGYYGPKAGGQPVADLKDTTGNAQEFFQREQDLFQDKPHKDDVEVLEFWIEGGKRVVTVANQSILLADKPNPFWFDYLEHPYPFVVCSGMPDLFRIPGISEVELIAELQEMLWTLMNQRLDSLQLVANAIVLVADDAEDPDAFEFAPGERWLVPRPVEDTVKMWAPDVRAAEVSLQAENLVRGDVQNVTGGMPFLSGTDTGTTDQKTATGVSIVTSLAQKRLAAKQQQFIWAKARIGEQWCALNQQYLNGEREISVIGQDGVESFEKIRPELIQGRYIFETEVVDESLMRSERRAEAMSKFQVAASAAGIFAAMKQPLNLKSFMDDVLDSYDITDKERYYSAIPQDPSQMGGGQPQQQGDPMQNGGGGGVTNDALAAGMSSPSNPFSMAPSQFMARALSTQGGPANVG